MIFFTLLSFFLVLWLVILASVAFLHEFSFLNCLHLNLVWNWSQNFGSHSIFLKTSIAFPAGPYSVCRDLKALWNLWNRALRLLCEWFLIFHHSPKLVFFVDVSEWTQGSQMLLQATRMFPRKHLRDAS